MPSYFPEQGDFIVLSLDPQSGHEQQGRRPALVVSNTTFNQRTGLAIICPVTSTFRNYPFHVPTTSAMSITGYVMVEQVKSVDFQSREARKIEKAPPDVLDEVLAILETCL